MAPPKQKKKKNGEPPPIDKLMKPAIVVGLAMLAYQFIKGMGSEILRVNTSDELELRDVLFGEGGTGKSYAVLCHPEESKMPISSVFQDASNEGGNPAEFRMIDCEYVLPSSEKTIAERFKLDLKKRPTIFLSGAVGEPKQITPKALKTGSMLVKYIKSKLGLTAAKIEITQDLRAKCLDKNMCGLLLKGTKKAPTYLKDAMNKLLKEFPAVSFAAMDASVLYAKNLEDHLPELTNEQPRFVVFKKISGSIETGGSRLITSIAPLENSGVSYGQMSNLVASVVSGAHEMTKLASLPVIKTRTKKLEQEEREKRQRKQNRDSKEADSSASSSFSANDGSKEGRRLERERRRTAHNAANNVKPKTPEEIAEMERQRRERMEEQASKWNVSPEDAPEEGGYVMDDGDYEDTTVVEDSDEDDEDVIDLD